MSHKEMIEKICELKKEFVEFLDVIIDERGLHCMDAEETGEVVDIIKDLAETEEKLYKAEYYKSIVEAMEDAKEEEELLAKLGMHPEEKMGYTPHRSSTSMPHRSSSTGRYVSRPGYTPTSHMLDDSEIELMTEWEGPYGRNRMDPYGSHYNEWKDAQRSYTVTRSPEDKKRMDEHATDHVMASITSLREVFKEADPEMKRRVKQDLSSLINEMKV